MNLLEKVKANLILEHDKDDTILQGYINSSVSYALSYQNLPTDFYISNTKPATTE